MKVYTCEPTYGIKNDEKILLDWMKFFYLLIYLLMIDFITYSNVILEKNYPIDSLT